MDDQRSLRKASAPDGRGSSSGLSQTLPPELLAEASRRLGWAGLIYGCTFAVAYFGPHLYATLTEPQHRYGPVRDTLSLVAISALRVTIICTPVTRQNAARPTHTAAITIGMR